MMTVPLTWESVNHLDTGLRRYDAVFLKDYLSLTGVTDEQVQNTVERLNRQLRKVLGGIAA